MMSAKCYCVGSKEVKVAVIRHIGTDVMLGSFTCHGSLAGHGSKDDDELRRDRGLFDDIPVDFHV